MDTYPRSDGVVQVDPQGKESQMIFQKDGVTVTAAAGGPLKPGIIFRATTEGEHQTKQFEMIFNPTPGGGAIGLTDEAVVAILYHRMRLKYAETGNDQWLAAAKYLEDVEESIHWALRT